MHIIIVYILLNSNIELNYTIIYKIIYNIYSYIRII